MESASDVVPLRSQFEPRIKTGVKLRLVVSHWEGRKHLPVVELQRAA
jgi:hypothetical protein